MRFQVLLLSLLLFSGFRILGQKTSEKHISGSMAINNGVSASLATEKIYQKGGHNRLQIGYGLRLTSMYISKAGFLTAPAKLTSGKQSLAAFFTEYNPEKIDTLSIQNSITAALNGYIHLGYSFSPKVSLGFNIDALGFCLGNKTNGTFSAGQSDTQGQANNHQSFATKASPINLLLISDSDLGTLNSELYIGTKISEKTGLKLGLSFQFVERSTSQNIAYNNKRFRTKPLLPMIGINHILK
jgi:hypothetical protein